MIGLTNINVKATENNDALSRLQYSEIYGEYHANYRNYNCYQFAIERFEEVSTYHFDSSFTKEERYHPGFYSTGASAFDTTTVDTAALALIVRSDLLALGMTDVLISNSIPILNNNEKLICMRVDNDDYHFMKYIKEEDIWVHKPMDTFPLKYNGDIAARDSWSNEGIMVSMNAPDYYHYTYIEETAKYEGEIKFIKYRTPNKLNLNCRMNQLNCQVEFKANLDIMYEMNVECEGTYVININDNEGFAIYIYDQYMMMASNMKYNENQKSFHITSGKYYLLIYYHYSGDEIITANFNINIVSSDLGALMYGDNTMEYLQLSPYYFHNTVNNNIECKFRYFNNNNNGFYKITVNNEFEPTIRTVEIWDNNKQIPQYDYENNIESYPLYTKTIIAYLENNKDYYLYLNTIEAYNDGISITIEYIEYNSHEINLFNANESTNTVYNLFDNLSNSSEIVQKLYLEQSGKFELNISYLSNNYDELCVWFIKEGVSNDEIYYYEFKDVLTQTDSQTVILTEGVYYIGVFQENENIDINILFTRIITDSGSDRLISDPDPVYNPSKTCGSHITVYEKDLPRSEKSYESTEILKGFTRVIYLDQYIVGACYNSDYYWYSSNDSVATISSFGTIHAKLTGTVRIMVVNKMDPSEVYIKEFTIVNNSNANVIAIPLSGEFNLTDGEYTLVLTVTNCPYPMIQYYNWIMEKDDNMDADMNGWGVVKAKTPGTITLIGNYIYNMNYRIVYTIVVKDS